MVIVVVGVGGYIVFKNFFKKGRIDWFDLLAVQGTLKCQRDTIPNKPQIPEMNDQVMAEGTCQTTTTPASLE